MTERVWDRKEENGKYYFVNTKTGDEIHQKVIGSDTAMREATEMALHVIELLENGDTTISEDDFVLDKDGWKPEFNDEKLLPNEKLIVQLYSHFNGDCFSFSPSHISVTEKTWYIFSGLSAQLFYEMLKAKFELFRLHGVFSWLGFHHSDNNRFCDLIRSVGYKDGLTWINNILTWLNSHQRETQNFDYCDWLESQKRLDLGDWQVYSVANHRTHHDDVIHQTKGGTWSYSFDDFITTWKDGRFTMKRRDGLSCPELVR